MPENHDADSIQLLIKQKMVGKAFQVRATPAAGIKMKPIRMLLDPDASLFELPPKIITQRIADRIIVPERLNGIPPDLWVKAQHQRPRSVTTAALS